MSLLPSSVRPARTTGRQSRHRAGVVGLAFALVLSAAACAPPVGSIHKATLQWVCWNAIFWTPEGDDHRWWAGGTPVIRGGDLEATPTPDFSEHVARGSVHVDTESTATFTSETGATVALRREPPDTPHTAQCAGKQPNLAADYVGTSRPATIDFGFDCWNWVGWTDDRTGVHWEKRGDGTGDIRVGAEKIGEDHYRVSGTMHFFTPTTARFTSAAGATLDFGRSDPDLSRPTVCYPKASDR